jgi:hypothetical protein
VIRCAGRAEEKNHNHRACEKIIVFHRFSPFS